MRSIKNIFLILVVSLIGFSVTAQEKTLLQTEMMAKQLDLDAKQKAELDKHFKSIKSERDALQVKMKALREEMQRDQFVTRQDQEAKLKSILSEEQFAKLQEGRKRGKKAQAARGQQRGMRGGRQAGQQMKQRKIAGMHKKSQAGDRQRMQRGQRSQRGQNQEQGQQREMFRKMLESNPEMKQKFQEYMQQERKKKEKSGGGN